MAKVRRQLDEVPARRDPGRGEAVSERVERRPLRSILLEPGALEGAPKRTACDVAMLKRPAGPC